MRKRGQSYHNNRMQICDFHAIDGASHSAVITWRAGPNQPFWDLSAWCPWSCHAGMFRSGLQPCASCQPNACLALFMAQSKLMWLNPSTDDNKWTYNSRQQEPSQPTATTNHHHHDHHHQEQQHQPCNARQCQQNYKNHPLLA